VHNTLRFARDCRDLSASRGTALEGRLASMGGFCDCEGHDECLNVI
jgi:hypothetical protein